MRVIKQRRTVKEIEDALKTLKMYKTETLSANVIASNMALRLTVY